MALPRTLTSLSKTEGVPARDAPFISLSKVQATLDAAMATSEARGYRVVGESGFKRLRDGRVRLYFDIQAQTEGTV